MTLLKTLADRPPLVCAMANTSLWQNQGMGRGNDFISCPFGQKNAQGGQAALGKVLKASVKRGAGERMPACIILPFCVPFCLMAHIAAELRR